MALSRQSDPSLFRSGTAVSTSAVVFWIFAVFLVFQVLEGVLRFALDAFGLFAVIYIPKVLMLFAIPILITNKMKISSGFAITAVVFGVSFVWGLINLGNIQQPLFGVWMFIPLIFSVLAADEITLAEARYMVLFRILVWLSAGGVILNLFVNFPWSGASINFGGQSLVASRQWASDGISRYGGFSSSSFGAATQIVIFAMCIVAFSKSKLEIVLTWLVGGAGIFITTSKGVVVGYIISTLYFLSLLLSSNVQKGGAGRYLRMAWSLVLVLIVAIMVVLPIAAINSYVELSFHSTLEKFLLESFSDRLSYMWPASLGLLNGDWHWLVGRGIGGIGTAQEYFELPLYVSGDNIFVYLTVTFGVVLTSLLIFAAIFGVCKNFILGKIHPLLFPFILVMSTYGIFANIVEDPVASSMIGISIGAAVLHKRHVRN
jgi:hypothetical protein